MSKKYATLAPRLEYLSDIVVLSQAWKKTHTYIRHHNWYADTLELDCSAVNLERQLNQWSMALKNKNYVPTPARLVPAPKSEPWVFKENVDDGWAPAAPPEERFLRPLAHVGIREQTVASAAMVCLADCVESAQGDTSRSAEDAQASGVFSYGNRLFCSWRSDRRLARFPWGNSNIYSRYFQDYQQFVERPLLVAQRAVSLSEEPPSLFIIKLDLSAFYDNINIKLLVARLKEIYGRHRNTHQESRPSDAGFWSALETSLSIGWHSDDGQWAQYLKGGELPGGLPQGLVASGFFANAYMVNFDKAVGKTIGRTLKRGGVSFRLFDYCRYVDDLRLVVSCEGQAVNESRLGAAVAAWIQARLDSTANDNSFSMRLVVNARKTEVEPFASLGGESGTAARMKSLQSQLSGPFDIAALQHVEAGLNGLLAQAELGMTRPQTVDGAAQLPALASVARPKLEVRDDTLTRFSAYRLTKALRLRRKMTDLTQQDEAGPARSILLHDFEVAARRLVAAWSLNPGLAQVLTYALDLFPAPELLQTVTDALLLKVPGNERDVYSTGVALYTLAQLFRAGATETGKKWENDPGLNVGDVKAYRELLGQLASALLRQRVLPWYVKQQALLLLASLGESVELKQSTDETKYHRCLHGFISGKVAGTLPQVTDTIAVSLVGYQLLRDDAHYARWFADFLAQIPAHYRLVAMELVAQNQPHLLNSIATNRRTRRLANQPAFEGIVRRYTGAAEGNETSPLIDGIWLPFDSVVVHRETPFQQENALLQLAHALVAAAVDTNEPPERWTPRTIELKCDEWARMNDPRGARRLSARVRPMRGGKDPRYVTPQWCDAEDANLYAIGRLLRSAATGELDFTARQWVLRDEHVGWYRGIGSTWQKRRIGMLNTSVAMAGTTGAITPWFSELLLQLLRWPGLQAQLESSNAVGPIENIVALRDTVRKRLEVQADIFGNSSGLPLYVYPVEWPIRDSRLLRVCVIQGLLPVTTDFIDGLESLNEPDFRARHRNHTASILNLAYQQLQARDSVLGKDHKPYVDLVVLPEYSVHIDDQDLMRAFSDGTGAMLFYGLCGATEPASGKPVNAARWLVPQRRAGGRSWIEVDQGKMYPTPEEVALGVNPWRPYQVVIELRTSGKAEFRISGAICYDATDISLPADLRNVSNMFIVSAMNKDVKTFDSMVGMLRYHMYQHVLVANAGEFGGSTAQAPYEQEHRRLISHSHGSEQIAVSVFDVNIDHFGPNLDAAKPLVSGPGGTTKRIGKTPPAGLNRH